MQDPAAKYLPPGYTLARDVQTTVPGAPHITSGDNPNATGISASAGMHRSRRRRCATGSQHRDADDADWAGVDNEPR